MQVKYMSEFLEKTGSTVANSIGSQKDRDLVVQAFTHIAEEMRRTNAIIARQTDELHSLATQMAVQQERNSLMFRNRTDIDSLSLKVRDLEDKATAEKTVRTIGAWFIENWAALTALLAAGWALFKQS